MLMQEQAQEFRKALSRGEFDIAERIAARNLETGENRSMWLNEMGLLLVAQSRFAEGLQSFDKSVVCRAEPSVEAVLNGIIILADLGFYDEAASRFGLLGDLDKDTRPSLGDLKKGILDAPSLADVPLSLRKRLSRHKVSVAKLLQGEKLWEDAKAELQDAIRFHDDESSRSELVNHYLLVGEIPSAQKEALAFLALHPQNGALLVLLARCYFVEGRRDEAAECLRRAEGKIPLNEKSVELLKSLLGDDRAN